MLEDSNGPPSTLGEYCEVSSCVGVIDWYKASHVAGKWFWFLMLIVCISLTTWQTYGTLNEFFTQSPFQTSVTKTSDKQLQYPAITVCNYNRAKQSLIDANGINPKIFAHVFQLFPTFYEFPLMSILKDYQEYEDAWTNFTKSSKYMDPLSLLKMYGHTINDTFIRVKDNTNQDITHFEEVVTVYGLCWKIKTNSTQFMPGASNGLKMMLDPKLDEYMKDLVINNYFQEGLIISIGPVDEAMMPQPIFIPPGFSVGISVSVSNYVTKTEQIPLRTPTCRKNTTMSIIKDEYSISNCMYDLFQSMVYQQCDCVYLGNVKDGYKFCNYTMAQKCSADVMSAQFKSNASQQTSSTQLTYNKITSATQPNAEIDVNKLQAMMTAFSNCNSPCYDFLVASIQMTMAKSFSSNLKGEVNRLLTMVMNTTMPDSMFENMIMVNLYFGSSETTVVETSETTPLFTLIGNVGGQLGLLVGMTILSIVQFLYYVLLGIFRCFICRMSPKQSNIKSALTKKPPKDGRISYVTTF